jgi:hypothetical protein
MQTETAPLVILSKAALDEAACAPFSKERRMSLPKPPSSTGNPGKGWGINPEDDPSAVGAALSMIRYRAIVPPKSR